MKLIVVVSYNKGVIACHPYEKMTGHFFAAFIEEHFFDKLRRERDINFSKITAHVRTRVGLRLRNMKGLDRPKNYASELRVI